ncbi:MAG: DUF4411 family protein [Patulibacter sp.]
MAYLLDTNVFITAKNSYYPFDFAPGFWDWIDREHASGNVFSIQRVRDELLGGAHELADWAKARGADFFLAPDAAVLPSLATIASWARGAQYEPVAVTPFLDGADYYLVAHAHAHGFDVVTLEQPSASTKKIKIPDACIPHGVKTINTFSLLRQQQARLVLAP